MVRYFNARPLTARLDRTDAFDIRAGTPAEVADGLGAGTLDLGLVPAIELLRNPDLEPVPGYCIAARGPVWSVLLLLRTAPRSVREVVLDPESRTSRVLAAIVLEARFGRRPRFRDPVGEADSGDARLLIGDKAIPAHLAEAPRLDLAEEFFNLTGLPMVFAVWAGRRAARETWERSLPALREAAEAGMAERPRLAAEEAARTGLPRELLQVYLERRIRYRLADDEQKGLDAYLQLARRTPAN